MTRINLGIKPAELCDAHLIAEYRELPRMRQFAIDRLQRFGDTGPRPDLPTLGTGHMAYFIPYGASLQERFSGLVDEMQYRGFAPQLPWRDYPQEFSHHISPRHEKLGRDLLKARLIDKLHAGMRCVWTRRRRPDWTQ